MNDTPNAFVQSLLDVIEYVMHGVSIFDNGFSDLMRAAGIVDPQRQIIILLVLSVILVVVALRAVGGFIGWVMLIFLLLLMLDRVVPSLGTQNLTPPGPAGTIQHAM